MKAWFLMRRLHAYYCPTIDRSIVVLGQMTKWRSQPRDASQIPVLLRSSYQMSSVITKSCYQPLTVGDIEAAFILSQSIQFQVGPTYMELYNDIKFLFVNIVVLLDTRSWNPVSPNNATLSFMQWYVNRNSVSYPLSGIWVGGRF
jgi:hypothetical protein